MKTGTSRTIKLILEYEGGAYCGWQRQLNGLSIQQVLEEAIGRITGEASRVIGSGRTDAGVHALRQCAHFHTRSSLAERNLLMGINSLLPPDISVLELEAVAPSPNNIAIFILAVFALIWSIMPLLENYAE